MVRLWSSAAAVDTGGTAVDPANHQHFAIFLAADNRFVLGMEDSTPNDLDFNNMIVQVAAGVPEPTSAFFVGSALRCAVYLPLRAVCR